MGTITTSMLRCKQTRLRLIQICCVLDYNGAFYLDLNEALLRTIPNQWYSFFSAFTSFSKNTLVLLFILSSMFSHLPHCQQKNLIHDENATYKQHMIMPKPPNDSDASAVIFRPCA